MAADNPRAEYAAEVQDLYEGIARLEEDYRFWFEGYERKRYGVQLAYALDKHWLISFWKRVDVLVQMNLESLGFPRFKMAFGESDAMTIFLMNNREKL